MVATRTSPSFLVLERSFRQIDTTTMMNMNPIESFDKEKDANDWIERAKRDYKRLHKQEPTEAHWVIIPLEHTVRLSDK